MVIYHKLLKTGPSKALVDYIPNNFAFTTNMDRSPHCMFALLSTVSSKSVSNIYVYVQEDVGRDEPEL